MTTTGRRAFLIDADNVSVEVIREALRMKIEAHGAIHVRRCYCNADFAVKNLEFLRENSIRAMVNATAGKNCTDIALAVDAVQLCNDSVPEVVVIVGSDSDFAPLVLHLRELGCRVEGVGQQGKTGADSPRAYDEFLEVSSSRKRPAGAARTPAKSAEAVAASERAAAPRSVRRAALPASGERLAPPAQRRSPPAAERRTTPPDEVLEILAALPRLGSGEAVELRFAAEALRKARLLTRNGSSTRLFKRHADWFVLAPGEQPNSVRYRFAAEA